MLVLAALMSCGTFQDYSHHSPTVSADGKILVYQSNQMTPGKYHLVIKYRTPMGWSWPVVIPGLTTMEGRDGAPFIAYDQNSLIISSNRRGGRGNVDLWVARRLGPVWIEPVNMGPPINTPAYEGFASLSPDGTTLYFCRECADKQKYRDEQFCIYRTKKRNGRWDEPVRLPAPVNSAYSEFGPIILADGRTLVFGSARPGGRGGYDLYKSVQRPDGSWSPAENLGPTVNTADDDLLVSIPASGEVMYSSRPKRIRVNGRDKTVYRITETPVPDLLRIEVATISGRVTDGVSRKALHASITITDTASGESTVIESNERDGAYFVILNRGRSYDVAIHRRGYTFYSAVLNLGDLREYRTLTRNIVLDPLRPGARIVLNNMFFRSGSAEVLPDSRYELRRLVELMRANPAMSVEITGHTDNQGAAEDNLRLSEQRAAAVAEQLARQGIARGRLMTRGFGLTQPVADNDTELGRYLNRRVEFTVRSMQ